MDSAEAELEPELNAPKRSDPSKLFNGTAANGSRMLMSVGSDFAVLVSGCTTGSTVENKSTVEGTVEGMAGWYANRSTSVCAKGHVKSYQCRIL